MRRFFSLEVKEAKDKRGLIERREERRKKIEDRR
jgi:hypothetical protein